MDAEEQPSSFNLAKRAWTSARAAFGSMKLPFMTAFSAYVLIAVLFNYGPWLPKGQSRIAGAAIVLGVLLTKLFLQLVISATLAVAVHRFILLDKRTPGMFFGLPSYTRRFLLWLLLFCAVAMLVGLVGAAYSRFWAGGKMLYWIAIIAVWVAYIMSVLILPAVAIEAPSSGWRGRIRTSWQQMEGWFWTFVLAAFLAMLPVVMVFFVVSIILGFADIYLLHDLDLHSPFISVLEIAKEALSPLLIVLGAAVASWVYAFSRERKAES